ncbi:dephospho-CoA kinase [bacterium]|nr:MAG: dephospho-CoA kinase [bacterium]
MVALTGGIAEGKSTVLGILREQGAQIVSADAIVRAMYDEPWVQDRLSDLTGLSSPIRPRDIAPMVLSNRPLLRRYGRIFHGPAISAILDSGADVAEIPLLLETCGQEGFEEVWCVTCGREEQIRRLTARLADPGLVEGFLAAQLPTRIKEAFADVIVRTDRPAEDVVFRVSQAWNLRVARAGKSCYTRVA